MASVLCLSTQRTNACLVAPAEPVQFLPMHPTHRVLQVLHHIDQKMAPKVFTLVMRPQMGFTVGGHAHQAGFDCSALGRAEVTGNFPCSQRPSGLLGVGGLVCFELRPCGVDGLAEGALTGPMDPPVFPYAAQAKAVSTGEGRRVGELIQTDAALRSL